MRAHALFDAERDVLLVRTERARVRANRASALSLSGDHALAEDLFAQAQQLFDDCPDDPDIRAQRAAVRRNRAANLETMGRSVQAQELRDAADALIGASASPARDTGAKPP